MSSPWPLAPRPSADSVERRRQLLDAEASGDLGPVVAGLDDPDERVRASAVHLAHRTGAVPIERLAAMANDRHPHVRRAVAEIAATTPALDLTTLLHDPDPGVVELACWAAGELGDQGRIHIDALIAICAEADDPLCREAAVAALGAIGDDRALPAILAATTDRATVRRRAILALAPFDTPEVDEALERALTDRDWQVRQAAEDLR